MLFSLRRYQGIRGEADHYWDVLSTLLSPSSYYSCSNNDAAHRNVLSCSLLTVSIGASSRHLFASSCSCSSDLTLTFHPDGENVEWSSLWTPFALVKGMLPENERCAFAAYISLVCCCLRAIACSICSSSWLLVWSQETLIRSTGSRTSGICTV
jgi:hypothetical protein